MHGVPAFFISFLFRYMVTIGYRCAMRMVLGRFACGCWVLGRRVLAKIFIGRVLLIGMKGDDKIIVFGDKNIRRVWRDDEWWFSVVDVVGVLSESPTPRQYWGKVKVREFEELQLSPVWVQLKMESKDGKMYMTDCANKKGIFRIIQSIPSKKAEPFKLWLAEVGSERIDEIENPELAQERMKSLYEKKGYSKSWIDKRLRGIAIRQDLTEEWDNRGVERQNEYAILTDEISRATFGLGVQDYKNLKNLDKENLRDHMDDWELILTMIGEKATTEITQDEDSLGFDECRDSAIRGGEIAGRTRRDLEKSLGRELVTEENYLRKKEKELREKKKKRVIRVEN